MEFGSTKAKSNPKFTSKQFSTEKSKIDSIDKLG